MGNDIETAKKIYRKTRVLYRGRKRVDDEIKRSRKQLTEIVSGYYWNLDLSLKDLEAMFNIPMNKLHLYAEPIGTARVCKICGEKFNIEAESRSDMFNESVWHVTCSNECAAEYQYQLRQERSKYTNLAGTGMSVSVSGY